MKKVLLFFICVLTLYVGNVLGQNKQFKYREVGSNYKNVLGKSIVSGYKPDDFFDITKALPQGYVRDGSIDYTEYVQSAVDKYRHVKLPNFPILINNKGIRLVSNSVVFF